ncbi:MAG TPA: glycoside hydrolase domain-containing protein, partial [Limnochordia bacterium]
ADRWVSWFDALDWPGQYFLYLIDEPRPDKFPWIREQAAILKGHAGPGAHLPIFTTRNWTPELAGAIDIWCAGTGLDVAAKAERERLGERFWFYNGYRPAAGSVILEADAVDLRVNAWIKWRYRIDTWFLWEGTHWRHNHQGPRAHWHQNVFGYPVTFVQISERYDPFVSERGLAWGNGDGILFYPGREPFYPEQDRLINGPLSSIRMKNHRRGAQDHAYIHLAAERAGTAAVDAIVAAAVPRAMSEVSRDEPVTWPVDGDAWEGFRRRLADLILGR